MAEQLGEAVLTVSADTRQLEAGLQRAKQQADQAGQALGQAFTGAAAGPAGATRSIDALSQRLQTLRAAYSSVEIGSTQFRKLQAEIQRTERELQQVDKTLGATFAQRAGGFGQGLLGALGVGVGIGAGAAVGGFLKESIQQAVELETVTRKLANTLGQQGAAGALNFTRGLANDLGLNFKTLADSFSRFTAAASAANVPLQTQRDLFAAVSRAGQSLGLSNDEINGSFLALQQVASKGTVAMEELRGQLGERLPIALSATAKGLGISQQELIKLVESGKLTAAQFFPALTKGLNELTAGAGGLETTAQKFAKFQNAWEQLQTSFGQNLLPAVTESVEKLTGALEGFGVVNNAKSLGFGPGGGAIGRLLSLSVIPNVFSATSTDTQGIQAAAALRRAQEQFNLNDQQARNIFSQALSASGGGYGLLGKVSVNDEQFARLLDEIVKKAEEFRKKNVDITNDLKAKNAAAQAANEREAKATAELQKQLDLRLKQDQAALQLTNSQARLQAAALTPGLDDAGQTRLQNELSLNEKLREVESIRLALQRELAKPKGTGDGKPTASGAATQNQGTINDLQGQLDRGRVDLATLRLQNQQADAAALRTQQDRIRGQATEAANAIRKLGITQQQTALERDALAAGVEVSRTAQLRLQQEEAIGLAVRQQADAQKALQAEQSKPKAQQDRTVLDGLFERVNRANAGVRQAYADAGLSLVQNARSAADALKSAQQGFNNSLQANFQFLTPGYQQQAIDAARASVNRGIASGIINPNVATGTTDQLFRAAQVSDQLVGAQKQLETAVRENAAATSALAKKDWNVYVNASGKVLQSTTTTPAVAPPAANIVDTTGTWQRVTANNWRGY